jgi:glutamate/tyrosine decarboxylase-like PLP-dependent enzyme
MSLLNRKDDDHAFPSTGTRADQVLERINELKSNLPSRAHGQFGLYAMEGEDSVQQLGEQAYRAFIRMNTVFSSVLPGLAMIEDDLQAMCVELHNGGRSGRANITSGGTESIYCALHAMRERARVENPEISVPEIIAPYSAHIAFSRGAHFLGMKLIRVPTGKNYRAEVSLIEQAVGSNTVGVVASAPCWPYDLFDPVSEIAQLTVSRDLWLHVDACVGGFLAPFLQAMGQPIPEYDFRVPGVNSISADLHKYGYSPKPCSSVLWRSEQEQKFHYHACSDWPSGPYLSQSMLGSGPAGATVAAWAVLNHLGRQGYEKIAERIINTKEKLIAGIGQIDGLSTWKTDTASLMIVSEIFDIHEVTAGMNALGWVLWGNNEPPLIHLTIDPTMDDVIQRFLADLEQVVNSLHAGKIHASAGTGVSGTGIAGGEDQLPRWIHNAWDLINSRS